MIVHISEIIEPLYINQHCIGHHTRKALNNHLWFFFLSNNAMHTPYLKFDTTQRLNVYFAGHIKEIVLT